MPSGNSRGYDGATKGTRSFGGSAHKPTHVPKPTDAGNVAKAKQQTTTGKGNIGSGVARLQAYKRGRSR